MNPCRRNPQVINSRIAACIVLVTVFALTPVTQAQFTDLINRVPDQANTLIAVNLEKALASPLANKEHWKADRQHAWESGMVVLPPQCNQFLMAAELDLEFMHPMWQVLLLNVSKTPSMPETATRYGGTVDHFGGRNAVVLPQDTYLIQFGQQMVGAMSPANRQSVGRWLRQVDDNRGGRLSPYLKQAIDYANRGAQTPIIMAIDLQDAISPDLVKQKAKSLEALKNANVDIDELAKVIASVQGMTLGITVNESVFGRLKVDFAEDASVLDGIAKPLLLEVLANQRAMIEEFETWKEQIDGKTASIAGYLDQSGLRRLMSLIEVPTPLQHRATPASAGQDEESLKQAASQQYFKQVTSLVDDLRQKPNRSEVKTWGQVGAWLDRYSRKIDSLPMLNVDEVLLDYGSFVSGTLREASDSLKNIAGRTRVRELNANQYSSAYRTGGRVGRWGGWGGYATADYYDSTATQMARNAIRSEERVAGTRDARELMRQIESATVDVRRKMVEKYKAEF